MRPGDRSPSGTLRHVSGMRSDCTKPDSLRGPSDGAVAETDAAAAAAAALQFEPRAGDGGAAAAGVAGTADDDEDCVAVSGYQIGELIGQGGFCKVKLGVQQATGQRVAVKIIDKAALKQPHDWRRVGREIRILKRLKNHPAVIHVYDAVPLPRIVLLVQELAEGGSLLDFVRARRRLPEEQALRFFVQIVAGLQFCHANGVAHRDIKLENLLMDGQRNMKIIDFGLATVFRPGQRLRVHCGSPSYAAPEIVARHQYDGCAADVWSLGIVTFAMVCGYLPFQSKNGRSELSKKIVAGVYKSPDHMSEPMRDLISSMLTVDPASRVPLDSVWAHPAVTGSLAANPFSLPTALLRRDARTGRVTPDDAIVEAVARLGVDRDVLVGDLQHNECGHATAIYFLLAAARARDGALPRVCVEADVYAAQSGARAALLHRSAHPELSMCIHADADCDDAAHFAPPRLPRQPQPQA